MTGANNLTPGFIKGRILLNLDSEDEGQLYIGCAGGANTTATFTFQPNAVPDDYVVIQISLTGLRGGHSGVDIHLGRGNANKIMNDLLLVATSDFGLSIASINGGSLRNAIPRESVALAVVPSGNLVNLIDWFETYKQIIIDKFSAAESEISIALNQIDSVDSIMDITTQNNLLNAVRDIPDGVITMSESVSGIVETSNNLAIISTHDNMIEVACMLRSLVDVSRDELADRLLNIFQSNNSQAVNSGVYPGWKPNVNSPVLGNMKSIYQRQFGNSPEIKVIHAGLECGIIGDKYPGMDMISFGPTIRHPHSPVEKVNIVSVEKFWSYLCEVLSSKISNQII